MVHLITGHAGKAHVKASDEAKINKALYGELEVAVDYGNNLAITLPSNNAVQIDTGLFYMQGRWIDISVPVSVSFDNGVADMNRNDLVVLRYSMDSDTSVETVDLVIKKGTTTSGTAEDPELETGQIDSGALINEVPLYRIPLTGINIGEPVKLFETKRINLDTYARKTELNGAVLQGTKITDVTQITSGGMYYSTGDCPNAPMTDGSYFNYFASKNGWLVNIIAVNCGNTAEVFASTNKTEDGSTWVNQGWNRLATETDLDGKIRFYTIDKDHQIGFLWKDGCVVPIIDSTELSGFAFQSDLNNYLPLTGGAMTGNITGKDGGVYKTDGNVYVTAGNYNKYLTEILNDLKKATVSTYYVSTFESVEDFVYQTATNSLFGAVKLKDPNGVFGLSTTTWMRGWISYQNPYDATYDVGGELIFHYNKKMYLIILNGSASTDYTATVKQIMLSDNFTYSGGNLDITTNV